MKVMFTVSLGGVINTAPVFKFHTWAAQFVIRGHVTLVAHLIYTHCVINLKLVARDGPYPSPRACPYLHNEIWVDTFLEIQLK